MSAVPAPRCSRPKAPGHRKRASSLQRRSIFAMSLEVGAKIGPLLLGMTIAGAGEDEGCQQSHLDSRILTLQRAWPCPFYIYLAQFAASNIKFTNPALTENPKEV